jgi:hypothetical protein
VQHEIALFDLLLNKTSGKDIFIGVDAVRMATINGAECMGLEVVRFVFVTWFQYMLLESVLFPGVK